uniref:Uncharacterized protein n=1 Tax=Rhizophagus irregularis (strain DAOM 181602 / DAOM 197198 / MUCL 43194) TaxID=747089 RepID=U9TD02_RHIID
MIGNFLLYLPIMIGGIKQVEDLRPYVLWICIYFALFCVVLRYLRYFCVICVILRYLRYLRYFVLFALYHEINDQLISRYMRDGTRRKKVSEIGPTLYSIMNNSGQAFGKMSRYPIPRKILLVTNNY